MLEFKSPSGSNNGLYTCGLHTNIRVFTIFSEHQTAHLLSMGYMSCSSQNIIQDSLLTIRSLFTTQLFAKCSQQLFNECLPRGRGNCMQRVRSKMFAVYWQ